MGLFNFKKSKQKREFYEMIAQMNAKFLPKGEKDMNAVTDAVLFILNDKIGRDEARYIGVRSVVISRISEGFSKERLKEHLAGYCIQHFNDKQIETFHGYLGFLIVADMMFRKTPSEVVRQGESWIIPE
jgi:hypothetical protein